MAKVKRQRTCLFCGGTGLTREHILARWIGRILRGAELPGVTVQFRHRSMNPAAGIDLREKTASLPAYYTRSFCRTCNGGWMSRLEACTRPVLEPLIHGSGTNLQLENQRVLALWAMKTMLAFQSIEDEQTLFARPADFRNLYEQRQALPYGHIWLGANVHGHPGWYRAHSARLPASAPDAVDGFGAILSVGFAVLYGVFLFDTDAHLRLRGDGALALRELARRDRTMRWPPSLALREVDLTGLPEALVRRSCLVPNHDASATEAEAS